MKATNTLSSFSILLIGSGRVARHLSHYLSLLNIHFETWDRAQDPHAISRKVSEASHVLLAISDSAIESFYGKHLAGLDKIVVHFSGAHHFEDMIAAHPLMTFGPELYTLEQYQKIHFTLTGSKDLASILPGLPNSYSVLAPEDKALYHAYCVLGGNFTTLLVNKMLQGLEPLQIPREAVGAYVQQTLINVLESSSTALTGPLARKDVATVEANLEALKNDPYVEIYKTLLKIHWTDFPRK